MIDAICISDLHLGSSICNVEKLLAFANYIKENLPAQLILNGDVLDSIEGRLTKKHWKVLSAFRSLSDQLKLIWVKGNHDSNAEAIAHLIGANFVEEYLLESNGRKIVFVHGDRWDDYISDHPWITVIADYMYYFLQKISQRAATFIKHGAKRYIRSIDKVKDGAENYRVVNHYNVVITSHTHFPVYTSDFCNTGCWTEPECHYVEVNAGVVCLKEFK